MAEVRSVGEKVAVQLLRWSPKGAFSRAVGWLSERRVPAPLRATVYGRFARAVGADLTDVEHPLYDFERFDDFFTRPLRAGARPISEGSQDLVSPVDALVSQVGSSSDGRLIQAKGLDYTVRGLLADAPESDRFEGGAYTTLYLAPKDYHRIHSPVAGRVRGYRHVPGASYPVNALSVRNIPGLFSINERLITFIESDAGWVAVVKVAATGVGHISAAYDPTVRTRRWGQGREPVSHDYEQPLPILAGDEVGCFHLGSTVILLFEPGRASLTLEVGRSVRMGERIGTRLGATPARGEPK
jgi:phosphatidylserine decarboxylase